MLIVADCLKAPSVEASPCTDAPPRDRSRPFSRPLFSGHCRYLSGPEVEAIFWSLGGSDDGLLPGLRVFGA